MPVKPVGDPLGRNSKPKPKPKRDGQAANLPPEGAREAGFDRARRDAAAGRLDAAWRHARRALAEAPGDVAGGELAIRLALRVGDLTGAADALATLAAANPDHPDLPWLRTCRAALAGEHREVRALLAAHPDLADRAPWTAAYTLPATAAATDPAAWRTTLDTCRATGDWRAWRHLDATLTGAQPLAAWKAAFAWLAEALYTTPAGIQGLQTWLQETRGRLPADEAARLRRPLAGLATYAAALRHDWSLARVRLAESKGADAVLAHQQLLLALYEKGLGAPDAPWHAWFRALRQEAQRPGGQADVPLIAHGASLVGGTLRRAFPHRLEDLEMALLGFDPTHARTLAEALQEAYAAAPDDPTVAEALTTAWTLSGRPTEALRVARRQLDANPEDPAALLQVASATLVANPGAAALAVLAPHLGKPGRTVKSAPFDVAMAAVEHPCDDILDAEGAPRTRRMAALDAALADIAGPTERSVLAAVATVILAGPCELLEDGACREGFRAIAERVGDLKALDHYEGLGEDFKRALEHLVDHVATDERGHAAAPSRAETNAVIALLRRHLKAARRFGKAIKTLEALLAPPKASTPPPKAGPPPKATAAARRRSPAAGQIPLPGLGQP